MERKRSSSPETGSTSHDSSGTKYDVFLSFRGPDTRATFTDSLYHTLLDKGISVFIDKEGIDIGEEIGPEIYQAIDDSKICIPIFSRDYASSSWCLRELEHMIQRWKTNESEVMPIFYDVEPSDVKLETGVYADALTLHKGKHGPEIVQRWAEALKKVTGIKGWDTKNRGHGELAHLIARKVSVKLKVSCVHISDHLVGMDKSANEVVDLLNVESKDVRLIGMWGMGGIGKTTLAKVVYDKLSTKFDSCSFISDIREALQGSSLLNMQKRLLSDIIGNVGVEPSSIDHGKNMIKNRFCRKKVLIFLDDVNHENQVMALAAKEEWFGSGSRIVVTTRDRSVFYKLQGQFEHCLIYEVKELNNLIALQLFSKHAFRSNSPPDAFLSLSEKVIAKTGGLPLAIEVIGSFLCGKKEERVWQDTLTKMEYCQHRDVKEKLMFSNQALDHLQQQIFLDIACFLAGRDKSSPYYMWDDCGFFPSEGIDVLILMSLVKIGEENKLWMHDQLKDLGKSIVYEENCKDPTKGSRLWVKWRSHPGLVWQKKGTGTVAVAYTKVPPQDSVLTSKDFIEVPNIRFLALCGWTLSGDLGDLFSELRWLIWQRCPKEMQATNFCPKNLVILELQWSSSIDEHWGGWTQLKVATRLKVLNLSGCDMLKETPDLSLFLSLEILILKGCKALTKLPNSIGMLKCLVELDVSDTSIAELPNSTVNLKSLEVLKMDNSLMQKLPEAIGMMEKLEEIHGKNCKKLKMLPSDIGRLPLLKVLALTETCVENVPELPQSLRILCLSSSTVVKVPEIYNQVNLPSLGYLDLCFGKGNDETSVFFTTETQPHAVCSSSLMELLSITGVSLFRGLVRCARELELIRCKTLCQVRHLPSGLRKLEISDCSLLELVNLSSLENLLELSLSGNPICDIQGLEDLASLQHLRVDNYKSKKFRGLERLKNLRLLHLTMCWSLRILPNLCNFKNLKDFKLWYSPKLVEIEGLDRLESLERLNIKCCSDHLLEVVDLSNFKNLLELSLINNEICDIHWLEGLASLQHLRVYDYKSSKFNGFERLKNLWLLQLEMCPSLQTLPNLSNLKNLKEFELWDCPKLVEIEGLDGLESLERLDIQCCSSLRSLHDLSHLKKQKNLCQIQQLPSGLRKLTISECHLLEVVDLSNLENLLELSLINNEICDIGGLEGLALLQCLRVDNCKSSEFSGLERLKNLQLLQLRMCWFLQTLPNLSNFKNLKDFELWYCPELVQIEGLDRLELLQRLDILCCSSLRSLPDLSHLKKLKMNSQREKPIA